MLSNYIHVTTIDFIVAIIVFVARSVDREYTRSTRRVCYESCYSATRS